MHFKTIYRILIRLLFPWSWHQPKQLAWLESIIAPIKRMDIDFFKNRNSNLYYLEHTSQVVHIESVLNDKLDEGLRRVRVIDGALIDPIYIFRTIEGKPVYIRKEAENMPKHLYKEPETFPNGIDFIVEIPVFITYNTEEITALVNKYRLPGTAFIIQQV